MKMLRHPNGTERVFVEREDGYPGWIVEADGLPAPGIDDVWDGAAWVFSQERQDERLAKDPEALKRRVEALEEGGVAAHEQEADPHPQYLRKDEASILYVSIGQDAWTYVKLAVDAVNATTVSLPTLLVVPAGGHVIIEGMLFLQSAAPTTGVQVGISWPVGVTQNTAWVSVPTSATAAVNRYWGSAVAARAASTAIPVANEGIHGKVEAQMIGGVGAFTITLASEVAASEARIMANSWLRYRTI